MNAAARAAAATLLDLPETAVTDVRGLAGAVFRVRLADGRDVVLKQAAGPGSTAAEAASLDWLAEPAATPVPAVLGRDEDWLALAWVESGAPGPAAAEEFGRALARLHAAGAPAFGAPPPGGPVDAWIGLAPMRDTPGPRWPEWYAEHRVRPYLRQAVDAGALAPAQAAVVERACERVPDPAEPPARLHGDLWSGNVHWGADDRVWLIDPAAHGGHRETDLAMLRLFGCPLLDRVLAAYREHTPLAAGWTERVGLHQLFPLAVHTALFGGGYAGQLLAAARSVA